MTIDATFWVAISFIIFFVGLIYLKVPQKINELLKDEFNLGLHALEIKIIN